MRVAFLYDAVYPYVKGGAERRYFELGRRLADRGHEVHWYGMWYWDGPRTVYCDGIWYHGVCRPRSLYTPTGRRSIWQAFLFGVACLRLVLDEFDVVDCCGFPYFSLFSAWVAVRLRGGWLVSTWHEVWGPDYWRRYLGRLGPAAHWVERRAAGLPHSVIAVSATTADGLRETLRRRADVLILPNGVDAKMIRAVPPAAVPLDIISAGRLCDYKDVDLLIASIPHLLESRPELVCCVIGDGPHRSKLEALVQDLGVTDHVQFTGFIEEPRDLYAAFRAARVFVLPSQREGFGIVVLEANAAGVPVVVVNHPDNGACGLISGDNGLVVDPDPVALAEALRRILDEDAGSRRQACWD